jgi:hypothetical protein
MKSIYFNFHWSQKKVWNLRLETIKMEVNDFIWLLNYPIWASNPPEKIFDLKPIDVLKNLENFPIIHKKIQNADYSFPIHIMKWNDRLVVMDGFHRILKTIINNENHILVKEVPVSEIGNIQPDNENPTGFKKYEILNK